MPVGPGAAGARSDPMRDEPDAVPPHFEGDSRHGYAPRSYVPRFTETRDGCAPGSVRLHGAAQPRFLAAGRACRDRREAGLADLQSGGSYGAGAAQGRRIPSLRLECVLIGALAVDRPRVSRT